MAAGGSDIKQLLLQVDASVELAKRNLNSLAAEVQRDSARMDKSLAGVDSAFDRLGAAAGRFTTFAGGLLGAIGVGTFLTLGREVLSFADDLSAASEQAGIGVERYQTLKEALRALEVDGDKADKIFKRLQTTLGDVQNRVDNGATKALDRLGVAAKIASGEITTSDELLDALAAAAKNAGSEAQFTSDVVAILGKKLGVEFANAVKDGGDALHDLEADLRSAGGVVTEEMIAKLAAANESIDRFSARARQQFAIFAGDTIGFFEGIGYRLAQLQQQLADFAPSVFASASSDLAAYESKNRAVLLQQQRWKVAEAKGDLNIAMNRLGNVPDPRANLLERRRVAAAAAALKGEAAELDRLNGAIRPAATAPERTPSDRTVPTAGAQASGGRKARSGGGAKKAAKREPTAAEMRDAEMLKADSLFGADFAQGLDFEKPLVDLQAVSAGMIDLQSILDATRIPNIGNILPAEEQERLERFGRDFQRDLADGLASAIVYGDDLGDVLVNTFKRAAAEAISNGLVDLLASIGSGGKGGGGSDFGASLQAFFASFGGGRAAGGPVGPGKWNIVGERGPEIFVPRLPGTIIPNHALGGGSGGGGSGLIRLEVTPSELFEVSVMEGAAAVVMAAAPGIEARAMERTLAQASRPRIS